MRFKLDENLPAAAQKFLREHLHDADTVLDEKLGGHSDNEVYRAAIREQRILVTLDLDFADIRAYPPAEHFGVWVLRPGNQTVAGVLKVLQSATELLGQERTAGRLWMVEPTRIRIHE